MVIVWNLSHLPDVAFQREWSWILEIARPNLPAAIAERGIRGFLVGETNPRISHSAAERRRVV
jgi:hypothetical protein